MPERTEIIRKLEGLSPKMFRLALRYTGDEHAAKDVVQQVMINIWKRRKKMSGVEYFESYCMTAVKHTSLDYLKKEKRHRSVDLDQAVHLESREVSAEQKLGNKQMMGMIKSALKELPENQRIAIHLRDIEGYSYKEITALTEMTMDQLKVNLHRARQRLKLLMQKKLSHEIGGN